MACKVVFVGGASFLWTGRFATDLFLKESLRGSRLVLVDLDAEALALVADYCRLRNRQADANWEILTADLDTALEGADYVMLSIAVGGLEAFDRDYRIPEKYGVFHTVGDTVGPAGISRVLRNVPVFVDVARRMERICPEAWMIHVTNPLAQLTRSVCKATSIRTLGLCHNYEGCMRFLADYFQVERHEVDAETFGVNHFTWLRNLTCRGEAVPLDRLSVREYLRYEGRKKGILKTGTTDDEINEMLGTDTTDDERFSFELCERFGFFPVGGPPHIAENFPYFLNSLDVLARHRIRRKGVLPKRAEGREAKRLHVEAVLEGRDSPPELAASHEALADIIESMENGLPCRTVVNMPNRGQVENLPADVVVETFAQIGRDGVTPLPAGPVPVPLKGFLDSIVSEEELAVSAALTGDRDMVVQAMLVSPLLHDKDAAEVLADELLEAQKDWLPQFFGAERGPV